VDKIYAAIEQFAEDKANETTENMEIPPAQHRLLIGTGGETRRGIESQFGIRLDIPKQSATGAARSQVKLSGPADKIAAAKTHIANMLQSHQGATVPVPRRLHHAVSNNGQFFRHLRNTHNVTVDHGGQQPPPKPAASSSQRAPAAAPPLITDETPSDTHSWVMHDHSTATEGEDGDIPWILKGREPDVTTAMEQLQAAIANAQTQNATGYLILPDPRTYRLVIGPGGAQINAIRDATGCKVTVPKKQGGEAIEVTGSREGVVRARDMILEAVQGGNGGGGGR
jgi:polyribonucleotide nucleotidyltransferase